ncbi:diaminohydroxyphosphoribosylaminopyrimidine deaminase [Mariniphaga anaerophila]|uniref:Riboflavin biosynthesis protein RibD n=2 Tax=Mariniphaga anaerophila TaxID=1484053 RepID=A0A1M5CDM7_9BACT|nr:diaminohydroxyphosphoribosylaminopyrimidine deaminase [Mariniphaga anaerophila]
MKRCLALARLGAGNVAPNPMVGSIIVCRGKIIGEGFHQKYGEAHAEVNAINAVQNPELLQESTLFVTLEPCAHQGLTPPCSDLIVKKQIPRVVIGTVDPFSKVAGRGIEKLRNAGIEVEIGVLEKECRDLNKRFFTFHEKKRPYVILKWAQTLDGFIDVNRGRNEFGEPTWITGDLALRLVHKIRSEESAVLVGTNTAEKDNPSLTVRHWSGKNPTRVLLDKNLRLPQNLNLFDGSVQTLVFNSKKQEQNNQIEWVKIDFEKEITHQILEELHHRKILSVVVEGGKQMLESFISQSLWDEAHIFIGDKFFYDGISAPKIQGILTQSEMLNNDWLKILANPRESN